MEVGADDAFDGVELGHHLLMVGVALGCSAGLDGFPHHHIDFQALFLVPGEFEEVGMLEEEVDVFPLLNLIPIIVVFGGIGHGVYSGLNRLYLTIISHILRLFWSGRVYLRNRF